MVEMVIIKTIRTGVIVDSGEYSIIKYDIECPKEVTSFEYLIGVDAGTSNMGIARIWSTDLGVCHSSIYQVKINRSENAVSRINLVKFILHDCYEQINISSRFHTFIIEGASFGNNFRQVELAEQRAAITIWALSKGIIPQIIPPTTIRKKVFGSGKIKAHEAWQLEGIPKNKQPNDALAALSCAYYGAMS